MMRTAKKNLQSYRIMGKVSFSHTCTWKIEQGTNPHHAEITMKEIAELTAFTMVSEHPPWQISWAQYIKYNYIYLHFNDNSQGGCELLHLPTNWIITCQAVTQVPVTLAIVKQVHTFAEKEKMPRSPKNKNCIGQTFYDSALTTGVDNKEKYYNDNDPLSDPDNTNKSINDNQFEHIDHDDNIQGNLGDYSTADGGSNNTWPSMDDGHNNEIGHAEKDVERDD
jgi:hypothetical protein